MRIGPPSDLVARPLRWRPVVRSWLGGVLLGDIPVLSGRVTWTVDSQVQGSLQMTVGAGRDGEWIPGTATDHALARFGQRLEVMIVTGTVDGLREWTTPVGTFQIEDWSLSDAGIVSVTAKSMLQRWSTEAFATPVSTGGSLSAMAWRLVPTGGGLVISPLLADRSVSSFDIGDSRIDALGDLASAWPCRVREDTAGNVLLLPPLDSAAAPVVTLRDGEGGTVVSALPEDSRSGAFNQVIARSTENRDDSDQPRFQAVATQQTGPMAAERYGVVSKTWASPLLTSQGGAQAAAQTMLANSLSRAQTVPVTGAPRPDLELDDPVLVQSRDLGEVLGVIRGVDLPLTPGDGAARWDVGVTG